MCVCVGGGGYSCTRVYVCACVRAVRASMHACVRVFVRACMFLCVRAVPACCLRARARVCVCVCVCVRVYVFNCLTSAIIMDTHAVVIGTCLCETLGNEGQGHERRHNPFNKRGLTTSRTATAG